MGKKFYFLFFILLLIGSSLPVNATNNTKVVSILEKVTRYQKSHPKLEGSFILTVNEQVRSGVFYFYNSEKDQSVKLFFGQQEDADDNNSDKYSYWVVNNNRLWVYLAHLKVLVDQSIPEYFSSVGRLGAGLTHYFSEYEDVSIKEIKEEEKIISKITFTVPKKNVAFQEVVVEITEDGFLRATYAKSKAKDRTIQFSFILNNLNDNPSFDEKRVFRVNPSGNVQILRNVLMKAR